MKIGASIDLGGPLPDAALLARNLHLAAVDSALQDREFLAENSKGPVSEQTAKVAELWNVIPTDDGALLNNPSEVMAFLEFGVGIYNEGEGSREPITPRNAKVLSWVGSDGVRHFAKSVKGYKGIAIVRNNVDAFAQKFAENAANAAQAALEGRAYG